MRKLEWQHSNVSQSLIMQIISLEPETDRKRDILGNWESSQRILDIDKWIKEKMPTCKSDLITFNTSIFNSSQKDLSRTDGWLNIASYRVAALEISTKL